MRWHRRSRIALACLIAASTTQAFGQADAADPVARTVYLMGTRASLVAQARTRPEGVRRLEAMVATLELADADLSTWQHDSAISRFNRHPIGRPWQATVELCALFEQLDAWQRETHGAFDAAIGSLIQAWDVQSRGRMPDMTRLERARERAGWHRIQFDQRACALTRTADISIDVGAFGKGAALDRVYAQAAGDPSWLIDLGGQVMVGGRLAGATAWWVGIAHPMDRTYAFSEIELREGSLSTTAGSERDVLIQQTRVGHVLDPRTGQPVTRDGSVLAWHTSALVADILSTALYVMGPADGLPWAEARDLSVCFLDVPDRHPRSWVRTRCSREFTTRFGRLAFGQGQTAELSVPREP